MDSLYSLTDEEFEYQFKNCILDQVLFSHEAHLRLAYLYIQKYGIEKAIEEVCRDIRQYAAFLGAHTKYNVTVTGAAVRVVHHFMLRSSTKNFQEFLAENLQLKTDFRALISSHYKTDIFLSENARLEFMEPELMPFN